MLPRRIVTALLGVTLVVALVGCSDDDDSEGGGTTTTTAATSTTDADESDESTSPASTSEDPETSTSEPATTDDDDPTTTTEGSSTSTPGEGGSDEECAGYQQIADASEAMDDLGDDWETIQASYPALAGDVIAGIDRALTEVDGSLAADLELMRGVIEETIDLAATSSSMEDFFGRATSVTGSEEADAAGDRVEEAAEERCGIDI